jgi:hypothetical protein
MPRVKETWSIPPCRRHVSKTALQNRQGSQIVPILRVWGSRYPVLWFRVTFLWQCEGEEEGGRGVGRIGDGERDDGV